MGNPLAPMVPLQPMGQTSGKNDQTGATDSGDSKPITKQPSGADVFSAFEDLVTNDLNAQQNSVLSSGNWYKIGVAEDGIYRLSYNDFQNLGVNTSNLNVNSIKLYGNGGGMLPYLNSIDRMFNNKLAALTMKAGHQVTSS